MEGWAHGEGQEPCVQGVDEHFIRPGFCHALHRSQVRERHTLQVVHGQDPASKHVNGI